MSPDYGPGGREPSPHACSGYLNNRYYDPQLGVFLSVDPLVATTGDPYLYGNGNPTTLSDPTGLDPGWAHDNDPCNDAVNRPGFCNRSVVALEGSGDAGGERVSAARRRTGGSQHLCRG